jgi:hypothetical protein
MTFKYHISTAPLEARITTVEITKEDADSVYVPIRSNGALAVECRVLRRSECAEYHDTWVGARDALLDKASHQIAKARRDGEAAKAVYDAVLSTKEEG